MMRKWCFKPLIKLKDNINIMKLVWQKITQLIYRSDKKQKYVNIKLNQTICWVKYEIWMIMNCF